MTTSRTPFEKIMLYPIDEKDFSIQELPEPIHELLRQSDLPWLNSLSFCLEFDDNRGNRVWLKIVENKIEKAIFYRLTKQIGFNKILVIGFPNADDQVVQRLMDRHNAKIAVINRLEKAVKPD